MFIKHVGPLEALLKISNSVVLRSLPTYSIKQAIYISFLITFSCSG